MAYLGDFADGETIYGYFSTHDAAGANVAPSTAFEAADIVVYKDGSATQLTVGITVTSPFDTEVGFHAYSVDTTQTGYDTGSDYTVVLAPDETVDGQTITAVPLDTFSIQNRYNVAASVTATVSADVVSVSGDTAAANNLESAYDGTGYAGGTIKQGVDIVAISGDTTSATNLEAYTDGTTPMPVNLTQWIGVAPLALSSQQVQTLVTAMGAGTVTAAAVATDAIDADALSADAAAAIVADIMTEIVETQGSYTVQQVLSVMLSVLAGVTSSGGTTIATPNGVSTRVAATTDASNNRTAMTLTPSS